MPPLTAGAVRAMLTRAGVDLSDLAITDSVSNAVRIAGPPRPRQAAHAVLFGEHSLACTGHTAYDEWTRP